MVTDFRFRLHPLGPQVMAGATFWSDGRAEQVLRFYRDWIADCPDELMTIVVQRLAPPLPVVPPELVGRPVIAVPACYAGDVDEGERVLRPMRDFGSPVLDLFAPKPFLAHQQMFDPSFRPRLLVLRPLLRRRRAHRRGDRRHGRARPTHHLTDDSIALWQMGGAVARVA